MRFLSRVRPTVTWNIRLYGHLRGPVSLTPVERLTVEMLLPVLTTNVCRDRGSNPDLTQAMRTLYQLNHLKFLITPCML